MFDEKEFVLLLIAGDEAAWRLFNKIYFVMIYNQAFWMVKDEQDALDVCQKVYIKVLDKLFEFKGQCKLSTWINKITTSESLNFIKAKAIRLKYILPDINDDDHESAVNQIADKSTPESILEYKEFERRCLWAIGKLKGDMKTAFDYSYFNNFTSKKIGILMNKPYTSIDALLSRAREKIREFESGIKKEKKKKS